MAAAIACRIPGMDASRRDRFDADWKLPVVPRCDLRFPRRLLDIDCAG